MQYNNSNIIAYIKLHDTQANQPTADCIHLLSVDSETNRIPFGSKLIGKFGKHIWFALNTTWLIVRYN